MPALAGWLRQRLELFLLNGGLVATVLAALVVRPPAPPAPPAGGPSPPPPPGPPALTRGAGLAPAAQVGVGLVVTAAPLLREKASRNSWRVNLRKGVKGKRVAKWEREHLRLD